MKKNILRGVIISLVTILGAPLGYANSAEPIASCTGTDNFGYTVVVKLTEGNPIPAEKSPNSKYYAEVSTYLSQKQIDAGDPLTTEGRLKSQLTSNPLEKTDTDPAVYWDGKNIKSAIFMLTIDGANSLLNVPDSDSEMGSSEFVNVALNCD